MLQKGLTRLTEIHVVKLRLHRLKQSPSLIELTLLFAIAQLEWHSHHCLDIQMRWGPHIQPHISFTATFFYAKKLHMWGKAIIFKDKPSTANSRGISPLFYVNQSAGTWGIAVWSQRDLATARRHFEHNSFLRPACLFCVYIWKTVNIGRLKLFIALEWRRFWVDI